MNHVHKLQQGTSQSSIHISQHNCDTQGICTRLRAGYDRTILCFGAEGACSEHLIGPLARARARAVDRSCVLDVVDELLGASAQCTEDLQIGLSCWQLAQDEVRCLQLRPRPDCTEHGYLRFASLQIMHWRRQQRCKAS